jgi:DNA-binding transcriptional ArsR family regulator
MSDGDPADLAARLAALEERVRRLEPDLDGPAHPTRPAGPTGDGGQPSVRERFWALEGLKERLPAGDGAVLFAGVVPVPAGGWYEWQRGTATGELLAADWSSLSATLAALGHPVRLLLLRQVLSGAGTVAELQERVELGTSGQLYHHLRQLVGAGWLQVAARGRYAVPPERVVPLLVVLAAARREPA